MKCFYHHDRDAVGICKACDKGLCSECAVDLTHGLACRERCEQHARAVIDMIHANIRMAPASAKLLQAAPRARMGAVIFYLMMGLVFTIGGYLRSESVDFIVVIGLCFLAYGAFALFQARKIAAHAVADGRNLKEVGKP